MGQMKAQKRTFVNFSLNKKLLKTLKLDYLLGNSIHGNFLLWVLLSWFPIHGNALGFGFALAITPAW